MCVSVWVSPTEDSPSKEMRRYGGCPPAEAAPLSPRFEVQPGHPLPALGKWARLPRNPTLAALWPLPSFMLHLSSAQVHSQVNIRGEIKHNRNYPWRKIIREGVCWRLKYKEGVCWPFSKYNTARLPAALSRWPLRWLSTSASAWPCLRFEVMLHEKHASWL